MHYGRRSFQITFPGNRINTRHHRHCEFRSATREIE
jgi:hypothetical protein